MELRKQLSGIKIVGNKLVPESVRINGKLPLILTDSGFTLNIGLPKNYLFGQTLNTKKHEKIL